MNNILKLTNYIGGTFHEPDAGGYIENFEPATGKVYSLIPDSDEKDVALAIDSAQKAFPFWSNLSNDDRSVWLMKIADAIENRLEEFALAESKDNGKPISLARKVDIPRAVSNFRFFANFSSASKSGFS